MSVCLATLTAFGQLTSIAAAAGGQAGEAAVAAAPKRNIVQMPDEYLPPNKILFVQNLPDATTKDQLEELFKPYPNLYDIRTIPGRKGIAFVEYADEGSSQVAREALHNYKIDDDHKMKVCSLFAGHAQTLTTLLFPGYVRKAVVQSVVYRRVKQVHLIAQADRSSADSMQRIPNRQLMQISAYINCLFEQPHSVPPNGSMYSLEMATDDFRSYTFLHVGDTRFPLPPHFFLFSAPLQISTSASLIMLVSSILLASLTAVSLSSPLSLDERQSSSATSDQAPTVTIRNGTVIGKLVAALGQHQFLGIPFAQPPVGNLRLRQALPLNSSFGTLNATNFGNSCISRTSDSPNPSEDCLSLNIVRPSSASGTSALPVLYDSIHVRCFVLTVNLQRLLLWRKSYRRVHGELPACECWLFADDAIG